MRGWIAIAVAGCGRLGFSPLAESHDPPDALAHDGTVDPSFDFGDFSPCPPLALLGAARCLGSVLELTSDTADQVGAAWSPLPFPITATTRFSVRVTARFGSAASVMTADGITITLQADPRGTSAIATVPGGYLAYSGITPSRALEVDVFTNTNFNDPSGEHLAFDRDGSVMSILTEPAPFALSTGTSFTIWLDYDGPSQTMTGFISPTADKPALPTISIVDDLASLGTAWIGLTGASGGWYQRHHILDWRFALSP